MRIPKAKFYLYSFPSHYPDGSSDNKYVMVIDGKYGRTFCDSRVRPLKEAVSHFWRLIGAE